MTDLRIEQLAYMSSLEQRTFWAVLEKVLANDDGAASKAHLAAGRPVTYRARQFPDAIMRKWPDGRRELVDVDDEGNVTILRAL